MPCTLTLQQLRAERDGHMAYLSGLLGGKQVKPLANLGELRRACQTMRKALEAQQARLTEQRVILEAQMADVEQQLTMVRSAG